MPVNDSAPIQISAFMWVPPFAQGLVRDLRVRWALEEAGLDYTVRLLDPRTERPADYLDKQPFGQVPWYSDERVSLFESGAIVLHIAEKCPALLPVDPQRRARAISWLFAALNSVEPSVQNLCSLSTFNADKSWVADCRPDFELMVRQKLRRVSEQLGEGDWLDSEFTAGDLIMTTVMRILRDTNLIDEFPNIAAWQQRCEARPAFKRALSAQMTAFEDVNT